MGAGVCEATGGKGGYFSAVKRVSSSVEVLQPKVESIRVDESFLGRILGYDSVIVRGTGGTFETFDKICQQG